MSTLPGEPITVLLDRLPTVRHRPAGAICERWDADLCVVGRRGPEGDRLLFISAEAGPEAGYRIHADPGPPEPGVHDLNALLRVIHSRLGWGGGAEP